MTRDKFRELLKEDFNIISQILIDKAESYSNFQVTDDSLYNFKEIAKEAGITSKQALFVLFLKHYIVIRDWIVNDIPIAYSEFQERVNDCINYFILYKKLEQEKYEFERKEDA